MATPDEYRKGVKRGRSSSLNQTINELKAILSGQGVTIEGKLRPKVYALIEDLAQYWYERGCRRGVEAVRKAPVKITRDVRFLRRASSRSRRVVLKL